MSMTMIEPHFGALAEALDKIGKEAPRLTVWTSGTSPNVLAAVKAAHEMGLTSWALAGPAPNPLAAMCDDAICVDAPTTATVQEIHLLLVHALCIALDGALPKSAGLLGESDG